MGDRPSNHKERLGAGVNPRPALVDWNSYFAYRQAQMNYNAIDPNPETKENLASFYNLRPPLLPVAPSMATDPGRFIYYPPALPKAWDLSLVHFQRPGMPFMGNLPGGPFGPYY
jgi:hypothetical protein